MGAGGAAALARGPRGTGVSAPLCPGSLPGHQPAVVSLLGSPAAARIEAAAVSSAASERAIMASSASPGSVLAG
jgi:hypothetical protein